jgi:putative membrane protein insertion efficiency factor
MVLAATSRLLLLSVATAAVQLPARALIIRPPCACCTSDSVQALLLQSSSSNDGSVSKAAISFLRWYKRTISPLLPPGCRFVPTCSEYAMQSFKEFPPDQAAILTLWRIIRCNPLHLPGYGFGVDEPVWPPPAYWAGSGEVRTALDDAASRRRATGGEDDDSPLPPFAGRADPLGLADPDESKA